jgi:hypothetical protein
MRTLKTLFTAGLLVAAISFAKADTQDRHLTGFSAVNVAGSFDVYITQGLTESVKVDAPSEVIDRIVTEVQGGILKIYTKDNTHFDWNGNKKMIVYVSIKDVNAVSLAGSGDVFFKDGLRAPSLKIKLTGSGDISGKVEVKELESSIGGSGDITLSGRAENSTVSVVGSGDFTGNNLVTNNTRVKVAGSGDARVNANDKIDASVVGSGDVHYTGSAKNISSSKAGSGSVSRM